MSDEIIIQFNAGVVPSLLGPRAFHRCGQALVSVCVLGLTAGEGQALAERPLCWGHLPRLPTASPLGVCSRRGGARCPLPAGDLALRAGDHRLGWRKGDAGNQVLHQLQRYQTTNGLKLTTKIKASSADLILEPEWVLG